MSVVAGLALVLVPTLFSVFPAWTEWKVGIRVAVVFGWFAAAAIVVLGTARQSEQVEDLLGTAVDRRDAARSAAGQKLLQSVLNPGYAAFPHHCEFRLFLPDESGQVLYPEFESAGASESEGWRVGCGATGTAWSRNRYVRVRGRRISDGTYGLTEEQQSRYRDLQAVISMPVPNARGTQIGVISISSEVDDPFLQSDDAGFRLYELAQVVARILIDIMQVQSD